NASFALNSISTKTLVSAVASSTTLNPVFSLVGSSSLTINWISAGSSYVAVLSTNSGFTTILASSTLNANATSYLGLVPNTSYYFEVKVATESNASFSLNSISTKTLAATSSTSLNPLFTFVSSSTLSVSWVPTGTSVVAVLALDSAFATVLSSQTLTTSATSY